MTDYLYVSHFRLLSKDIEKIDQKLLAPLYGSTWYVSENMLGHEFSDSVSLSSNNLNGKN